MLLKRALPVGAVLIAAGSIVWSAGAASAVTEHKITEMERIAPVTIKHGSSLRDHWGGFKAMSSERTRLSKLLSLASTRSKSSWLIT